jgi:hypothetical protein
MLQYSKQTDLAELTYNQLMVFTQPIIITYVWGFRGGGDNNFGLDFDADRSTRHKNPQQQHNHD